jgi:hypothetical protein
MTVNSLEGTHISISRRGDPYEITITGVDADEVVRTIVAAIGMIAGKSDTIVADYKLVTSKIEPPKQSGPA